MRTSASGATSARTIASGGSSARSSTRCPHSTVPPCWRRIATSASVDGLRAALGDRPADEVGVGGEREADAGREPAVERQHRVGGEAGEQGAAPLGRQPATATRSAPSRPGEGEAGQRARVARERRQRQQVVEYGPKPPTSGAISRRHASPSPPSPAAVSSSERCSSADPCVERVGQGDLRVHPPHAVLRQRQVAQRRRTEAHRQHRRAHVVAEAGLGQLGGPAAATRRRPPPRGR